MHIIPGLGIYRQQQTATRGGQKTPDRTLSTHLQSAGRSRNEHVFQRQLESHLYDVKMRKPWRNPSVHTELKHRHADNREILAGINPSAMRMYVGLISGVSYKHQARLASNVFQMSRHLEALSTVSDQLAAIGVAPSKTTDKIEP